MRWKIWVPETSRPNARALLNKHKIPFREREWLGVLMFRFSSKKLMIAAIGVIKQAGIQMEYNTRDAYIRPKPRRKRKKET